jgi:hypothetical protein
MNIPRRNIVHEKMREMRVKVIMKVLPEIDCNDTTE